MTYSNPRLKHVKRIKKICTELEITGAMPGFLWQILHQCNLLLETKKAKKRKKCEHSEIIGQFNATTIFDRECASCHKKLPDVKYEQSPAMKFMLKDINTPDPKEESKKERWQYRYNGVGEWKDVSLEPVKPLNLANTTTSRPELRQTEKEIMIENKINEIIDYLKAL